LIAALALVPSGAAQARDKAKSWEDFLPARLGEAELIPEGKLALDVWDGKYRLPGGKDADARQMTISIAFDPSVLDKPGTFVVRKPGETQKDEDGVYEGMRVNGRFAQRKCDPAATECQVDLVLVDRVWLQVRVKGPTDRGEPLRWLKRLDLKGMEALARKEKLEPLSKKERQGKLQLLEQSEELQNLKPAPAAP